MTYMTESQKEPVNGGVNQNRSSSDFTVFKDANNFPIPLKSDPMGLVANSEQNQVDVQNVSNIENLLNEAETSELGRLEHRIEKGLRAFWEIGQSLDQIRDQRLYRQNYKTFEEYCLNRWEFSHRSAYRLIQAASVYENLLCGSQNSQDTNSGSQTPANVTLGSQNSQDGNFGSQTPTNVTRGSQNFQDGDFGSQTPTNVTLGSQNSQDTNSGSQTPANVTRGSQNSQDGNFGSQTPANVTRGSQNSQDGNFGSQTSANVTLGSQIKILPTNERQVRPLTSLSPEKQREVWWKAVSTAPNGRVTSGHVAQIVKEYHSENSEKKFRESYSFDKEQQSQDSSQHSLNRSCWNCQYCSKESVKDEPESFYCDRLGKLSFVEKDGNKRGAECEYWNYRFGESSQVRKNVIPIRETFNLTLQLPTNLQPLIQDAAKDSGLTVTDWLTKLIEENLSHQNRNQDTDIDENFVATVVSEVA